MYSTGSPIVDKIASLHLEGNIIPTNWFDIFKLKNGKTDVNAIIILSEIVYWYRPSIIRDEDSGRILRVKKKFKADVLQRSYASFSDQFGLTKDQVRDAISRLEEFGIVRRDFRTIDSGSTRLGNVLFIELNANLLIDICTLSDSNPIGYQDIYSHLSDSNPTPMGIEPDTNTKTTTEITNNTLSTEWQPKKSILVEIIRLKLGAQTEQALTNIEYHLGNFNAHWENKTLLTENQKHRKFAAWLISEFEKAQRAPKAPFQKQPYQRRFGNSQQPAMRDIVGEQS